MCWHIYRDYIYCKYMVGSLVVADGTFGAYKTDRASFSQRDFDRDCGICYFCWRNRDIGYFTFAKTARHSSTRACHSYVGFMDVGHLSQMAERERKS